MIISIKRSSKCPNDLISVKGPSYKLHIYQYKMAVFNNNLVKFEIKNVLAALICDAQIQIWKRKLRF